MSKTIDYGQQIKEMLIEKGLEQKELALVTGIRFKASTGGAMSMIYYQVSNNELRDCPQTRLMARRRRNSAGCTTSKSAR